MSIWDTPELKVGGEFVRFDHPGDAISGTIQVVRAHRFDNGDVAPQILLVTDAGEEKTVTAGQIRLKNALAEQRPEAGDWIAITLTQIEQRAGGKSLKHFDVQVRRGGAAGAPAASTIGQGFTAPPPAPVVPQPVAAPVQQYAAPAVPQAAPVPQPAAPSPTPAPVLPPVPQPAPQAAPAAPAAPVAGLTPEQQAAIAALSPEQRAAMGFA